AVTFAGLVGGILFTGPLADRWGGRLFSILGTLRSASAHLGHRRRTDTNARSLSQLLFRSRECGDLSWRGLGVGAGTVAARLRRDESWFLKVDRQCFFACFLGCHGAGTHLCRTDRSSS